MAAKPMPGALYIVSNMSATSPRMSLSISATGLDTRRSRLSGKMMMSRSAIEGDLRADAGVVNVEDDHRFSHLSAWEEKSDRALGAIRVRSPLPQAGRGKKSCAKRDNSACRPDVFARSHFVQ